MTEIYLNFDRKVNRLLFRFSKRTKPKFFENFDQNELKFATMTPIQVERDKPAQAKMIPVNDRCPGKWVKAKYLNHWALPKFSVGLEFFTNFNYGLFKIPFLQ